MITWHPNYLYSFDIPSLDNKKLYEDCIEIEKYLKSIFPPQEKNSYGSYTASIHKNYNLFTLPLFSLSKLYKELVNNITPLLEYNDSYHMRCWLNVFRKGDFIDWHNHWPSHFNSWHGFYCINTNNSSTLYNIPDNSEIIEVPSKEGRIVIGKSDNDTHTSTPWENENQHRITIAFDLIPLSSFNKYPNEIILNHFIPFK